MLWCVLSNKLCTFLPLPADSLPMQNLCFVNFFVRCRRENKKIFALGEDNFVYSAYFACLAMHVRNPSKHKGFHLFLKICILHVFTYFL